MIEIVSKAGVYKFDPDTERLFRDNIFIPKSEIEPLYSGNGRDKSAPSFAGLWIKNKNQVITLTGNIKPLVDINQIH
jgi:hypothetical protein